MSQRNVRKAIALARSIPWRATYVVAATIGRA
jgi:hypothetical protein